MPPRTDTDTPITMGLILKWGGTIVGLVLAIGGGFSGYNNTQNRISALETRLSQEEVQRVSDHDLLSRIDRKLLLLICKSDPAHCDAQ